MSTILIPSHLGDEKYDFEKVAQQACASVWYQCGGTVILASIAVDEEACVQEDFLPLTIQYIEKAYASAKFPSGFIKRESKPSDFEVLTSRIIDRTLRPLFPKGYVHPTQISIMVLSYDGRSDLQIGALHAASSVLYVSGIPIYYPVNAVRIGKNESGLFVCSEMEDLQTSMLDLYVSGYNEDVLMIEMRSLRQNNSACELSEEEMSEAIKMAQGAIAAHSKKIEESFKTCIKPPLVLQETQDNKQELVSYLKTEWFGELKKTITQMAKSERMSELKKLAQRIASVSGLGEEEVFGGLQICKKIALREMILDLAHRADGRRLDEVRPIQIQTNVLPFAHGSCLFKRGQTQALVVATIGGETDAQGYELLGDRVMSKERFMVHYNFPGFSVGEVSMITAPGRRELGHGNLAKRALESSLKDKRVVRLVSEILESNGSSSMATVCGGSLALKASGVESEELVAGVAMGLVKDGERYAILTDIMGLEDHCGDMDFKVAGTHKGITALQMDIKLGGLSTQILKEAIEAAKKARLYILGVMENAQQEIRINDQIVPMVLSFGIPSERIVEIIGPGGKTIKEIIEKFSVTIDLDRNSGEVCVSGVGQERLRQAKEYILGILEKNKQVDFSNYRVGLVFEGKIKKLVDFGAFVEMPHGGDGLLHISKFKSGKVVLQEGQMVECKILSVGHNKIELDLV